MAHNCPSCHLAPPGLARVPRLVVVQPVKLEDLLEAAQHAKGWTDKAAAAKSFFQSKLKIKKVFKTVAGRHPHLKALFTISDNINCADPSGVAAAQKQATLTVTNEKQFLHEQGLSMNVQMSRRGLGSTYRRYRVQRRSGSFSPRVRISSAASPPRRTTSIPFSPN